MRRGRRPIPGPGSRDHRNRDPSHPPRCCPQLTSARYQRDRCAPAGLDAAGAATVLPTDLLHPPPPCLGARRPGPSSLVFLVLCVWCVSASSPRRSLMFFRLSLSWSPLETSLLPLPPSCLCGLLISEQAEVCRAIPPPPSKRRLWSPGVSPSPFLFKINPPPVWVTEH